MNLAQESPAQDTQDSPILDSPVPNSPTQVWVDGWLEYLFDRLPVILLIITLIVGVSLIAKAKGGLGKVIAFGFGAALVYLLLTNVEAVSRFFSEELPITF